jgi:hypothetical protein
MHHCLFVQIHLITCLIDNFFFFFENTKRNAIVNQNMRRHGISTRVETRINGGTSNEHTKTWDDMALVLESKPELMGALHSRPYECPVSVLTAIWNFTQQCRRSQNDLWLNTAWVGWHYSRTSWATGIKEPPARRRDTEVYSYPATMSHLRFRKQQYGGWWVGRWMEEGDASDNFRMNTRMVDTAPLIIWLV